MRSHTIAFANAAIAGFVLVSSAQQLSQAAWEALLAEFQPQLKAAFPTDERYRREIRVYCTADVTGDGVEEALVTLGYGGAYTEVMTLRLESRVPATTSFRRRDGSVHLLEVLKGSSAKNHVNFRLHPDDRAISQIHCTMADNPNEPETAACSAESYVWNNQTQMFEYVAALSERVAGEYLRQQRERESSKYFPPPNQPRVPTECGERAADDPPRLR